MNEEGRTLYPARHAHVVDLGSSMMLAEGDNTVANNTTIDNVAREFDVNEANASRECSREHSLADKFTGTTTTTTKLSLAEQEVKSLQPHVEYFSTGLEMHPSMSKDNLSRDSEIHDVQKEDEIYGSQADRKVDDTDDAKPLFHDANARLDEQKVTEFDLAAYAKEDLTLSMQQKIMRRMFNAFDVQQHGFLDVCKLKEFCTYVGTNLSASALEQMYAELHEKEKDKITFDIFWQWWLDNPDKEVTENTISFVSADFSVPYHQQQLKIKESGQIFTPSYRVKYFFKDLETGFVRQVSPWHDVPLFVRDPVRTKPEKVAANRYNFVCEIPKWTRAKFEIATSEPFNPIKQDIKNGIPRFYKHGDMMWNYGAFPQTWESTEVVFEHGGVQGDNDPIDGVEIGMRQFLLGEIHPVKVLGILGMIDDNQMDWKVICMSVNDPIVRFLKDIDDVPKFLPGCLDALREWFRVYKICQGGVENKFAFDGEFKNKDFAMKVIDESHYMWENLRKIKKKEEV